MVPAAASDSAREYLPPRKSMITPDPLAGQITELYVATMGTDGRAVYRNRPWIRLLGDSDEPWSRLDPQDALAAAGNVRDAAAGSLVSGQLFLVSSGGRPVPLLLHFLPVRGPDHPDEVVAVAVSGELLVQPESWSSAQTERHRMETLGRMTMGMAHDFNNLLSAILGHTELLRIAAERLETGSVGEHVSTIERAARDGASLVARIQRYIRQEQQSSYVPLELTDLIRDGISLTRPYWYNEPRRQGIEIRVETSLDDVPPVLGSAAELRDVLVNLILNAVQAMPDGGSLRFETFSDGDRTGFRVGDTGEGMTAAVRERIFEPLFTTKGDAGNGMGLAVTYGIVQEHGGSISVESEPGAGAVFSLSFPAAPVPAAPEVPDRADGVARSTFRLLVVDDEAMVRSVLHRLLALRGHDVTEAASGAEGLELAGAREFDLVITDQGMPGMSGREFAAELRRRGARIPVVLLSGDTHVGSPDETIGAVLSKPFRIEEVESTIRRLA
jgi:signal transduction histidine kinase